MINLLNILVFVFLVGAATYVLFKDLQNENSKAKAFFRWLKNVIDLIFGL